MYSQLRTTIATLRLSLVEIENKESQLDSMIAQFQTQLRRLPRQVIYGRTGLDASLAAMGEIEERLADGDFATVDSVDHQRIERAEQDRRASRRQNQVVEQERSLARDWMEQPGAAEFGAPPSKQRQRAAGDDDQQRQDEDPAGRVCGKGMDRGQDTGAHQEGTQ